MTHTRSRRSSGRKGGKKGNDGGLGAGQDGARQRANSTRSDHRGTHYAAGPALTLNGPVQTQLTVGPVDDPLEREADAVAQRVAASADPGGSVEKQPMEEEEPVQPLTIRRQTVEEEEPVQRQTVEEEEPEEPVQPLTIQRQAAEEEEPVQRQADEEEAVQRTADGRPHVSPTTASTIRNPGAGQLLQPAVRRRIEPHVGADLGNARVHSGGDAGRAAASLGARAFTHRNHIFLGSRESSSDVRLLAHEATHVVQQSGSTAQPKLFRQDDSEEGSAEGDDAQPVTNTETEYDGPEGTASTSDSRITIEEVHFPAIDEKEEKTGSQNVEIRKGSEERDTRQITVWSQLTRDGDGLNASLDEKTRRAWHTGSESNPTYFMRIGRGGANYLVGTRTAIRDRVIRPYWKPNGEIETFDVDHKKEYQLGGHDREPDDDNLWLLESTTNRSAGSRINNQINEALNNLLAAWTSSSKPDTETARNSYTVILKQIHWDGEVAGEGDNYSKQDIAESAEQMEPVVPLERDDVQRLGLDPGEGKFVVFNNATGGRARTIELPSSAGDEIPFTDTDFIAGFRPTTATFVGEDSNYIEVAGTLWADNPAIDGHGIPTSITIRRMGNLPQTGYVNFRRAEEKIRQFFDGGEVEVGPLSPLVLTSVEIDEVGTPIVEGIVDTNIGFLQGANIGFFIRGDNLGIEKTFSSSDLNTPRPFEIEEASLTVSLSTQRGFAAEGNVDFKIEGVGEGSVTASEGTSEEFALAGNFNFDERIFGQGASAQARMAYEGGEWSVGGTLTIPRGKVPGVRTATISVDYSENDGLSAEGDAQLDAPGVESATLALTHSEEEGFTIGGTVNLSADTPGIRGGTLTARLQEQEDGEGYSVTASGEAEPDIPGIDSNLSVSYNDGAFTAEVEAEYSRGMLSGRINAGVTNRSVGEDGQLSDTAEPDDPLIVYGGGELTVQIAPWLQGTAGVQFAPDGEITVTGEIALPDELEIFPRREFNKSILNIAVQTPIVPGIVAEIGGGLSATAGIGPGVLDQLELGITYNPAHEEDTTITGDAHLGVPADAGLRLSVRAGIGLGITGASATGGLEIGGTLGIEGMAEASVHVDWTPRTGLDLTTTVSVHAQPAFTFDISGYVSVRALGFSVYDESWEFASFRFGSDYRFGISLPIHYQEGQPFDISVDDIEFEVPDIDTDELLEGLVARIA